MEHLPEKFTACIEQLELSSQNLIKAQADLIKAKQAYTTARYNIQKMYNDITEKAGNIAEKPPYENTEKKDVIDLTGDTSFLDQKIVTTEKNKKWTQFESDKLKMLIESRQENQRFESVGALFDTICSEFPEKSISQVKSKAVTMNYRWNYVECKYIIGGKV